MAKFLKEYFDKKETFHFGKRKYTSICEAAKTFSSSVWLKKKHVKNTGIYRYSDGGISVFGICDIDPL
jgi:hypothetical protein